MKPVALSLAAALTSTAMIHAGICERTLAVRQALVDATSAATCASVRDFDLREVRYVDLSNQNIESLRAGDFDDLVWLERLDLSGNLLASLPPRLFDELYMLTELRLDSNQLSTLPSTLFDQLLMLELLTLDDNPGLSLPSGMFEELGRFDGFQSDGTEAPARGSYPRLNRFLLRHEIGSVAEFTEALPDIFKERFVLMYESGAPSHPYVSPESPRVTSWGHDADYIFSWIADESAPVEFADSVEFLRRDDYSWTAGVIDFSASLPAIREPAECSNCHGSLNKPLWGRWNRWTGSEFTYGNEYDDAIAAIRDSGNERLAVLDFSASTTYGRESERFFVRPGRDADALAAEEAAAVWSWQHAKILYNLILDRHPDMISYSRPLCEKRDFQPSYTVTVWEFDQAEHNLFFNPASEVEVDEDGLLLVPSDFIRSYYHYNPTSSVADSIWMLIISDLLRDVPVLRHLYRNTTNTEMYSSGFLNAEGALFYRDGRATAEDEFIQKIRLHFGRGTDMSLSERARMTNKTGFPRGVLSSSFWESHLEVMRHKICDAMWNSVPRALSVALENGRPHLSWQEPTYDPRAVSGYRVRRNGTLIDTFSTSTAWTDEDAQPGDHSYTVAAIYDRLYETAESGSVPVSVPVPPEAESQDLPRASIVAVAGQVSEGERAEFRVSLSKPAKEKLTVGLRWTRSDRSQSLSQYTVFHAGTSVKMPSFMKSDDKVVREDLTVSLALLDGEGYVVSEDGRSAEVVVEENDEAEIALLLEPDAVAEGKTATVRARIANGVTFGKSQTIKLRFAGSTATMGTDYTLSGNYLTLAEDDAHLTLRARKRGVKVVLTATADTEREGSETVQIEARHNGEVVATRTLTIAD